MNNNVYARNGHVLGEIVSRTFYTVRKENHVFHKFGDGFGFSTDVLEEIQRDGVQEIIIEFHSFFGTRWFHTTVAEIQLYGKDYIDRGDRQKVLPMERFKEHNIALPHKMTGRMP